MEQAVLLAFAEIGTDFVVTMERSKSLKFEDRSSGVFPLALALNRCVTFLRESKYTRKDEALKALKRLKYISSVAEDPVNFEKNLERLKADLALVRKVAEDAKGSASKDRK